MGQQRIQRSRNLNVFLWVNREPKGVGIGYRDDFQIHEIEHTSTRLDEEKENTRKRGFELGFSKIKAK